MGNVTVKEGGEMVNIISPNVNNITSFKVHFSPKQEGTGDPSPENVREIVGWNGVEGHKCGKNMAHIFGYGTQNIIDTDVNRYKTTNTHGTTINTTIFNNPDTPLIIEQSQAPNSTTPSSYQNGYIAIGTDNLIFGQKYNVSFKVSNITNNILNISLNNIRLLVPNGTTTSVTEIIDDVLIFKNITFYQNTTTPKRQGFEIRICGFSFTLSEFMVTSVDNEDFTYEPYQGTELNINWTNNIKQWIHTDSSFDTYSTNIFNGYANSLWDNAIKNIPAEWFGKSLTYSVYIDRAESPYTLYDDVRVWFYGDSTTMEEASWAYRITEPSSSGRSWVTFTIPEGTTKLALGLLISKGSRAYNPQLEYGEEPTEYQPYVGDVYGGYVDLVNGELVVNMAIVDLGTLIWTYNEQYTTFLSYPVNLMSTSTYKKGLCSQYVITKQWLTSQGWADNDKIFSVRGQDSRIRIKDTTYTDASAFKTSVNGVQFVYELADPIRYQLTPQQLSILKGQNNFWSNADYVEIEYELTETFDIQKAKRKIILNQPHTESTSGTIAKPETDMIGKIKECKIHFIPVQQGDGDPTPDNIVPVIGWTGIDVYQAFTEYPITPTVNTTSGYGVKWVVDKDGLMTAYGTPTAYTGAILGTIDVNGDETLYGVVAGSLNNVTFNKPTLLNSNNNSVAYTAGDGILIQGLDLSLYNDIKKVRIPLKRSGNVFMSGSCNAIIWKDKKPTVSTTSIDWTNIAGTMYGGYVDLISGELVQEFKQCKINELSWIYESNGKYFMSGKNTPNDILKDKSLLGSYIRSNYYTPIDGYGNAATYADKQDYSISLYAPSDQYRIAIKDSRFTDVSSFLSAMGDTYIWYRLAEPTVTYQLTPQQLTTLRGINNIWSSANGEVEIKYWKH